MSTQWPHAAANPAIASLLQSKRPVRRVAELGSFGKYALPCSDQAISQALDALSNEDCECFSPEAVRHPAWQAIREQVTVALSLFGWQEATVRPFTEASPGVWTRPPDSETCSAIGLAVWLAAPSLRKQIPLGRGLLAAVISAVLAAGIASLLILSRSH